MKIGDKVKIKDYSRHHGFSTRMEQWIGKEAQITSILGNLVYLDIDEGFSIWKSEWLEEIKKEKK